MKSTFSYFLLFGIILVGGSVFPAAVSVASAATLSANPTSISQGNSSLLTWSSDPGSTCSGNFNMGNQYYDPSSDSSYGAPASGSIYVSPLATKTYGVTCVVPALGGAGSSANATVTVTPGFLVSCSAAPAAVQTGENVTWTATASGGTPPYSFTWGGDGDLAGMTGAIASLTYATIGTKSGTVSVTDSNTVTTQSYTPVYNDGNGVDAGQSMCTGATIPGYGSSTVEDYPVLNSGQTHQNGGPGFYLEGAENYNAPPDFPSNSNYCVEVDLRQQACGATGNCEPSTIVKTTWHVGTGTKPTVDSDYPPSSTKSGGQPAKAWYGTETFKPSSSSVPQPQTVLVPCSNTVEVSAPPFQGPDLTAGSVNPTSTTPNTPTTLSATILNAGTSSTGGGFSDFFQESPNYPNSGGEISLGTYASAAIAVNANNTASISYSFPSVGVYYVRACADKSSAGDAGVIAESNENNNCGAWTPISVTDNAFCAAHPDDPSCIAFCAAHPADPSCANNFCAAHPSDPSCINNFCAAHPSDPTCIANFCATHPADPSCINAFCAAHPSDPSCINSGTLPTVLLTATPDTIVAGSPTELTWVSQHATSCTGAPVDFAHGAANNFSGAPVSPNTDTTYSITCKDAAGHTGTSTAHVTVVNVSLSVTATPDAVRKGEHSTITWSASGSHLSSCTIVGPNLSLSSLSGHSDQTIDAESTYTLSCIAGTIHPSASATVTIVPSFTEF